MYFYEVFALKSKSNNGYFYKFFVRRKKKKYVVDYLGWCRLSLKGRKEKRKKNTLFFCLNFRKFSNWFTKGVSFKPRAFWLIFSNGFIYKEYIMLLSKKIKKHNNILIKKINEN